MHLTTAPGTHSHKCPNCGHLWSHPDTCVNDCKAHACPECGTHQWVKHVEGLELTPARELKMFEINMEARLLCMAGVMS